MLQVSLDAKYLRLQARRPLCPKSLIVSLLSALLLCVRKIVTLQMGMGNWSSRRVPECSSLLYDVLHTPSFLFLD